MKIDHRVIAFEDKRGRIMDILQDASVEHIALFTTKAGMVRGNHYHKVSTAYVYVLSGRFMIHARMEDGPVTSEIVDPGDLVTIYPQERHALTSLEDSSFLMMTHGPDGGRQYESDTVREAV